ncbi:MAG: hypothetical protein BEN19_06030 [Epulopiscium sp. Nuni2H_MBin003]|nr:MAG: hypothetical protein BEN19_06030 [Epulopiscium sp. Nuni2H_MBin003]
MEQAEYFINYCFYDFNMVSIFVRLALAVILGGSIGLDREKRTRSAGFRTHSLVCIGGTLIMLTGNYININFEGPTDVARLGAQVVSGIGFLGAGTIMSSGHQKVVGLTTATALWICAGIGLALGVGFYEGAFVVCFFTLISLRVLRVVDKKYRRETHFVDIYLELHKATDINNVTDILTDNNVLLISLESKKPKITANEIGISLVIKLKNAQTSDSVIKQMNESDKIAFVHKVYL